MTDRSGFDVRPEAVRSVAAGLRDDAGSERVVSGGVDNAVTPMHGAGGALAVAVSELATALAAATGGARRDLEALAGALDATALGYQADDRRGSTSFGALLSPRIAP